MNLNMLNIMWFAPVKHKEDLPEVELDLGVMGAALDLTKLHATGESHLFYNRGKGWEDAIRVVPQTLIQIRLKNGTVTYGYNGPTGVIERDTPRLNYTGHHYRHQIICEDVVCKFRI